MFFYNFTKFLFALSADYRLGMGLSHIVLTVISKVCICFKTLTPTNRNIDPVYFCAIEVIIADRALLGFIE